MLLTFLKKWQSVIGIVLVIALGALWRHAVSKEKATEAQLVSAKTALAVAQASIQQLQGAIADQNKAVEAWKAAGAIQAAQVSTAQAKAGTVHQAYEVQARAALVAPAPQDAGKALDWLVSEVQKVAK